MAIMQTNSQRLYTGLKTLGEFRLKKRKPLETSKLCCHGTNYAGQKEPFLGQMISTTHLQMVGAVVYYKSYTKSNDLKISMRFLSGSIFAPLKDIDLRQTVFLSLRKSIDLLEQDLQISINLGPYSLLDSNLLQTATKAFPPARSLFNQRFGKCY
ncbi:Hypothetical_protein [Hexamita inflata]|uniref:Hypothetical_protein n=1 Tax=Hexamita inflata TaxID=28002 RepID=A0AA86PCM2_9EUKA|nr:Hypothetical protein HINF_LOCUS23990 [Hexamita inflata]